MRAKAKPESEGLVGFFGHTYIDDSNNPGDRMIQYQFRIIRKMDTGRYVIHYYSFMDGSPNALGVMTEAKLLGDAVRLYPDAETWNTVYHEMHRGRGI